MENKEEISKSNIKASDLNERQEINEIDRSCVEDHSISNLSCDEIDNKTISKLRGDAIGDTMYSESFVVKTLMKLSNVVWNEELEEDLCFLWDMTVEKDVCDFLLKLSFPSVVCNILTKNDEQRLIEIIIGILANIFSCNCVLNMSDLEIDIVLNVLNTDDHLILIQVMRFIKVLAYQKKGELKFITSDIFDKINFILTNSINKDLLMISLDVVSKLTIDFKMEEKLIKGEIINSCLVAYSVVFESENVNHEEYEIESTDLRSCLTYFLQIILNFCCYINQINDRLLLEIALYKDKLIIEFDRILQYFSNENNLIPLTDDLQFCMDAFTVIFPVLRLKYHNNIFFSMFKMILILIKNNVDTIYSFIDLTRYLISVGEVEKIVSDLKTFSCNHVPYLEVILSHKSDCEYEFKDNIVMIIDRFNK